MRTRLALAALFCLFPIAAHGEAFGIKPAQPIEDLTILGNGSMPYILEISPPEPNSAFTGYSVFASPSMGVCSVSGFNHDLANEAAKKELAKGLEEALTELYGEPEDMHGDGERLTYSDPTPAVKSLRLSSFLTNSVDLTYEFVDQFKCMEDATPILEVDRNGL